MEGSENRIAEARDRLGLKQVDLAARIGVSRGQLANMESGTRKVDLPQLRQIARVLNCSVADLLLPEDIPDRPSPPETAILNELRTIAPYEPRAVLAALRGVLEACRAAAEAYSAPRMLAGDATLARRLTDNWNTLDDAHRDKVLGLLDAAREFSR
jgi:transcriptional regulator with XRE-family HTH domain